MLTQLQEKVVDYALSLSNKNWMGHSLDRGEFPPACVISSGTSTGKTAIILATAQQLLNRGKRCMIMVHARFIWQWQAEYAKFRAALGLANMQIIQAPYPAHLDLKDSQTHLTLVSMSVQSSPIKHSLMAGHWDVALVDEAVKVPAVLLEFGFGHAVCFNASNPSAVVFHQRDDELGVLPKLSLHFYLAKDYRVLPPLGWRFVFSPQHTTPDIAEYHLRQLPCGRKTVIMCFDTIQTLDAAYMNLSQRWQPENATHVIRGGSQKKSKVLAEFRRADSGVLWGPGSYLSRGFDISCDTLILLDLCYNASAAHLYQAIGRVRRTSSQHRKVQVHLVSINPRAPLVFGAFDDPAQLEISKRHWYSPLVGQDANERALHWLRKARSSYTEHIVEYQ